MTKHRTFRKLKGTVSRELYGYCNKCGEYHDKRCCVETAADEWLCDMCRGENYAPTWRIVIA